MENPIGYTIGNALEVAESLQCLQGHGPEDLMELVCHLGKRMMYSIKCPLNLDIMMHEGKILNHFDLQYRRRIVFATFVHVCYHFRQNRHKRCKNRQYLKEYKEYKHPNVNVCINQYLRDQRLPDMLTALKTYRISVQI